MQGTCGAPLAVLQVISGTVLLRSEVLGLVTSQMDMRLPPPHVSLWSPLQRVLHSASPTLRQLLRLTELGLQFGRRERIKSEVVCLHVGTRTYAQ